MAAADVVLKRTGNPIYLRDKNEDSKCHLRALVTRLKLDPAGLDRYSVCGCLRVRLHALVRT